MHIFTLIIIGVFVGAISSLFKNLTKRCAFLLLFPYLGVTVFDWLYRFYNNSTANDVSFYLIGIFIAGTIIAIAGAVTLFFILAYKQKFIGFR